MVGELTRQSIWLLQLLVKLHFSPAGSKRDEQEALDLLVRQLKSEIKENYI